MAFRVATTFSVLFLLAGGGAAADADIGYELLVASAGPDVQRTCFEAKGLRTPTKGAFFIGGPAKFDMGGYSFQSFFDGYGRMNRFELQDGAVCFTAKYMNTSYYKEAEALGRPAIGLFMGTEPPLPPCPLRHPFCKVAGAPSDNNWVNLLPTDRAGEGLLLTDSPFFVRFDYDTMATFGSYHWKDGGMMPKWLKKFHAPATGSAHPVHRPKTESTWIEVMLEAGLTQALAVYTIDTKTMDRALLAHVPMKGAMYFHSFGVSENYVALPCNLKMGLGGKSLIGSFTDGWDGIHVVDRDGKVQVFDTEKFFHVHIANTFENETGIVMDLGTFQNIPFSYHTLATAMFLNKTERDTKQGTMTERIHLHLRGPKQGQVTREHLGLPGRANDFFKINHQVWGLPYCAYYSVEWFHNGKDYASMAISKHNTCIFAPGKTLGELDADGDGVVTTADTDPMSEVWGTAEVSPDPIGLLGSGCAGTAMNIANIAYMARFPMVSNSATRPSLSDRGTYPNFFRTIMPDTTFNAAWVAMAAALGHTTISVVIADTENWASMGTALVSASQAKGVQLVGNDLTTAIAGLQGMQISLDSQSMARAAAADLVKFKQRIVILLMFHKRNRYLMCEAYKLGFVNAVYMPMGWLPFGWWAIHDTPCTPAEVTSQAIGFISANMMFHRGDMGAQLSCSSSMTAQQFVDEWFSRQGGAHGDLSMRPEGYAPALEAGTTADAMCMYATMLHEVLINRNVPLSELTGRTSNGYDQVFDVLSNIDFEGVQGRVRFQPGSADPVSQVIMQQLQDDAGTLKLLDVCSYTDPTFNFLGKGDLVFQYPGEVFEAGPMGATSISATLSPFVTCGDNRMPDLSSNTCVECPENSEFVQFAGACLCVAGFYATDSGCSPCPAGTFSNAAGTIQCSVCPVGQYAPEGSSRCTFCPRGTYSDAEGLETCRRCPAMRTTADIAAEAVSACVCDLGTYRSGTDCLSCPANATTSRINSASFSSCMCPQNSYMDGTDCQACPAGSATIGIGKTRATSCLCDRGTYLPRGSQRCEECLEGMQCPRGSNAVNDQHLGNPQKTPEQEFPKLRAGFWASLEQPLSVFACGDESKCPGNRYPGDACAANLHSQACQHCRVGYHWSGTRCEECASIESTNWLFPIVPIFIAPVIIMGMYKMFGDTFAKWGSWQNGLACLLFITLNHYQTIDILTATNIPFPPTARDAFNFWTFTNDFASVFKVDCTGLADFKATVIMRGLAPPVLVLVSALAVASSRLAAWLSKRQWLAMQRDRTLNVVGSLMFTFFSAIAAISLLLFKCSKNPNGTSSLVIDLSVVCFESEDWKSMLVAAIVFVLVYIIGMGGVFVRAVVIAPKCFVDPGFQMRYKFLFIKFRADVYWWSISFLIKNFLVSLVFAVAVTGVAQLYLVMTITTLYLGGVVFCNPYRHRICNILEAVASVCIVYVASLLTWHADRREGELDSAMDLTAGSITFIPLVCGVACMVYMYLYGARYPYPQAQVEKAEMDFAIIHDSCKALTYLKTEDGGRMLLQISDWDRHYMKQAAHAILTDVVGAGTSKRVVDKSLSTHLSNTIEEGKRKTEKAVLTDGPKANLVRC